MAPLTIDQLYAGLGWYGKLSSAGDFVHRRVDRQLIQFWHTWISHSCLSLKNNTGLAWSTQYLQAPIWNFVIPASLSPDGQTWQLGAIAPSQDRVGRLYPLLIVLALPAQSYNKQMLAGSHRYLSSVGQLLRQATQLRCSVPQFEAELGDRLSSLAPLLHQEAAVPVRAHDILDILNAGHSQAPLASLPNETLSWPDLEQVFHPHGTHSYWWTNRACGAAHRALTHAGSLSPILFNRLFSL